MALITDPDLLTQDTEVVFDAPNKTIQLVVAGNLSTDGVTLQCVYSFCKEEWKTDANLIKYPFPVLAITEEKFEMISGWDWKDTTTRELIRTGGWALNPSGTVQEEYAGIITLGSIGAGQAYYQQVAAGAPTNVVLTGAVNQAVKTYGDATHGDFNYRTYFKVFCREYAKTYAGSSIGDIGVTTMTYQVYRFPLANADDLKIEVTDANLIGNTPYFGTADKSAADGSVTIDLATFTSATVGFVADDVGKYICINTGTNAGFYKIITFTSATEVEVERNFLATESTITFSVNPAGMVIDWYAAAQQRSIGGTNYDFHAIIDGNQGTAEQIYTFVQYQLRQNNDIDNQSTSKIGKVTNVLLSFVGDSLYTLLYITGEGTYIDDFQSADTNRLYFTDDTNTVRQFPYVAVLTLNFGDNLKNDSAAKFWAFFTNDDTGTNLGRDYGTAQAILVNINEKAATTYRARASNVATITTAAAHGLAVGEGVDVSGMGGTGAIYAVAKAPTAGGTGYAVDDTLIVSEGTGGQVKVVTVSAGVVTAIALYAQGTAGYTVGTGKATTGGTGTGCTIEITGAGYNIDAIVASVPDAVHFTYASIGADEIEAADTGGTTKGNMVGNVGGASSKALSFDYDNNVQRGNTLPNESPTDDAPITVVAIGEATGQFVSATGTIARSITNVVSLIAALERNYSNV